MPLRFARQQIRSVSQNVFKAQGANSLLQSIRNLVWKGGPVHATGGTMAPQFKSNKRPGGLVWISEHVLSHTEGWTIPWPEAAPRRTPALPSEKKRMEEKKNADSLSPTVHFSILGRGQIGYGKLLSLPLSLLFTLSGSSLSPLLSCAWNKPRLTAVHLRHA